MTNDRNAGDRVGATIYVGLVIVCIGLLVGIAVGMSGPRTEAPPSYLPPCQTEDSDNCYWDGDTRGNGTGESFVSIRGEVYYLGR